jgi:acyl-CoA synthetase (NDP forming)
VCSTGLSKPTALVLLDQADAVRLLPSQMKGAGPVPAYAYPRSAARALGHAARYGAWRARTPGHVPEFADLRPEDARALISEFLERSPDGGWLSPAQVCSLLRCYGIRQVSTRPVTNEQVAGEPIIQPMTASGTEVILRVVQEPVFGPLVVFGLRGAATDMPDDRTARLTPLTDTDSAAMIRSIRAAPLLLGHRGTPAADLPALQDLLLRIARLADDLPQVAELDLCPVVARPDGAHIVDARVRLSPVQPSDAYLRRLR